MKFNIKKFVYILILFTESNTYAIENKDNKYYNLGKMARRFAHQVQKTKTTYTFDPMPADERRIIHNACSGMEHIRTESSGEGTQRQVHIIYVD